MLAALAVIVLAGCTTPSRTAVRLDGLAGIYDTAVVTYRLDASRMGEPMAVSRIQGQLVSYEQRASATTAGAAQGTLMIEYPHPAGVPGFARARVVMQSQSGGFNPARSSSEQLMKNVKSIVPGGSQFAGASSESWVMDIPKIEVDRLIGAMHESGYFSKVHQPGNQSAGVELVSTLDGKKMRKNWRQVAELDAMMLRVRQQGRLETYNSPVNLQPGSPPQFESVMAYREFRRSEQEAQKMLAQRARQSQEPSAYAFSSVPSIYPPAPQGGYGPYQPSGLGAPPATQNMYQAQQPGYGAAR
jgi:hypothetical protein